LWREGFRSDYATIPGREEQSYIIPGTDYDISKGDIPGYLTAVHYAQIGMWDDWRLLGDPWGKGWANWPAVFMDVIKALEQENRKRK